MLCAVGLGSCDEENGLPYYDENSLDVPYLFSEGYQDQIQYPYELATPLTDWLSLVRDDVKVCKLSIPGTHDSMTGMGFYTPVVKYFSNIMAISQVSTFDEQMSNGIRFFDFRPVVAIDTLAQKPEDRQILRLAHGFTEVDVTLEESIDWMQQFLKSHPSEFFIVKIQADNGMESQQNWTVLLNKVLSMPKYQGLFVESRYCGSVVTICAQLTPPSTILSLIVTGPTRIPTWMRRYIPSNSAVAPSTTWRTRASKLRSINKTTTRQQARSAWQPRLLLC